MPRVVENHEQIVEAFQSVDMISQLVERLPNGEFRNELDMDIILFGRSYREKKVGPYARLLEYSPGETIVEEGTWESSIFYILVKGALEASVTNASGSREKIGEIPAGGSFGEIALLSGTRRTATVSVAEGSQQALVLELSRPAMRLLRKLSKFAKALDRNYRAYGLTLTINELQASDRLQFDDELATRFNDAARFAVYEKDHVLFQEGDPINRVYFIRNGWIERVSGMAFNPKAAELFIETDDSVALDFLGSGKCIGLEAVGQEAAEWNYTALVRERTEMLEIAVTRLRDDVELRSEIATFFSTRFAAAAPTVPTPRDTRSIVAASREIETGVVDGVNLVVMDMAKCIRCGNCSLACHKIHGQTRLVRRGIHIERPVRPTRAATQSVLVPSVCMHCRDAECLTGCPTGAIARFPDGQIDINPATCIGCSDCATQCPYDAISMIAKPGSAKTAGVNGPARIASVFSLGEQELPPAVEQTENLLAVKCNLCHGTPINPPGAKREAYSCEENCPTGALVRVDPREYFDEINESIGIVERTATHAIGVNIHRSDVRATLWHVGGILAALIVGGAAVYGTQKFSQDAALLGGWLTMRWLTGLTGLGAIVWVMLYPMRKQVYRRRAGALRYWMLSHTYLGVLAGVVLLVHGGTSSGGLLTTTLMISFDLVIASGIFGAACYLIVPRLMTRIEPEPLLIEDLEARQAELRAELVLTVKRADTPELAAFIQSGIQKRFLGLGYLLKQYTHRENLNTMLADARQEFHGQAEHMPRSDYTQLMDAVENAATLRRVDALVYLHRLLKLWLPPHVLFTSIMLVLMVIHIAQAIYFNVR